MQVLIHNKNEAYKHIQAELGRALLRLFDSKTDRDDALISNYANARKNPSKDIVKKALHVLWSNWLSSSVLLSGLTNKEIYVKNQEDN